MRRVLGNILCDLDDKFQVKGKKGGICDGVILTAALVFNLNIFFMYVVSINFQMTFLYKVNIMKAVAESQYFFS